MSASADQEATYHNQTAILSWLRRQGHPVRFNIDQTVPSIHEPPRFAFIGRPCPYCGEEMTRHGKRKVTREHLVPRSQGGTLHGPNRVIVCERCNMDRSNDSLPRYAERLTRKGLHDRARLVREFHASTLAHQNPAAPAEGSAGPTRLIPSSQAIARLERDPLP